MPPPDRNNALHPLPSAAPNQIGSDARRYSLRDGLRPVIILGAGRSGTKFLRRLVASSSACGVVPYGVSYAWRYGNAGHPHDVLPASACTPRIARHVRRTLLRLSDVPSSNAARYLVEKTSANTLRVAFVDAVLPDAQYIHIVRDGRDVVESALRRWTAPPEPGYLFEKWRHLSFSSFRFVGWYLVNLLRGILQDKAGGAIWGPRYPGITDDVKRLSTLEVCAKQWRACVERALRDLQAISTERILTIRYEELVSDPTMVDQICRFLQLPDPETVQGYYHENVRRDAVDRGRRALSEHALQTIQPILEPTLQKLDYCEPA